MKVDERLRKVMNIENKKAYHDYFVEEKLECGIMGVIKCLRSID